ncbi:sulfatase-like hydrolase/transferase [Arcticibacterium luteifluviistationis]|uniref:Acetylglucosamine-6-sulfatase n=1 Tax=Arcticibacterium luteifluviistationis TaxID=1784714 RepID=A0A2Z4GDS1_9BACT|nr:sulfatase-like hydrolase/transferase [Arcticibacterium luteifluviistationis]AWV99280.1 acetylglucosamine-6-sulfatase [Arcticibacterium luteifluviistationis]
MPQKTFFSCLYVLFCLSSQEAKAQDRPNFVFILTDDQSYGMMGCDGNSITQTPNIDQLASEGVFFTNAHITSGICTPSRVSILLGQYERKHQVNFNSGTSISPEAWNLSYPMLMKKAGYYTGWIGKNHAPIGDGGYESGLMDKSFDYWYAGHGHLGFYPKDRHKIFNGAKADTQVEVINEGINDFLNDSNEKRLAGAVHFLTKRPTNQPFVLSISLNLPHAAGTSSMKLKPGDDEIYRTLYRDKDISMPPNYVAKKDIKKPKLPADLLRAEDIQQSYNSSYTPEDNRERIIRESQAITGIDRLIGNLRKTLKEQGIDKNTVIIFTSDHGLFHGEQGLAGKALCYEIVTHVPLIIYNPSQNKQLKGMRLNALVQSIDIPATMLSLAGIEKPNSFQGKDISELLTGKKKEVREYVFTENLWSTQFGNPRCEAVQNKEWKYIRYYKNETFSASKKIEAALLFGVKTNRMLYDVHDLDMAIYHDYVEAPLKGEQPVYEELYHLKSDPFELDNLIAEKSNKEILKKMRQVWKEEINNARGTEPAKVLRYTVESHNAGSY